MSCTKLVSKAVVLLIGLGAGQLLQAQVYSVLYSFSGGLDGGQPLASLVRDSAGNLYGTTSTGGGTGLGNVFKLDTSGNRTLVHGFSGADGSNPQAPVIRDTAGNLYGTTISGGTAGLGVVFKINKSNQETVLHSFTGGVDGAHPVAGLVRDPAGNLYGTTLNGGTSNQGTVFKVTKTGVETVLYSFSGGSDGGQPYGALVRDSAGNLYGTTSSGGAASLGTVFKIDPSNTESVIHSFAGGSSDGASPQAGLIRDSAGNLYGTTSQGGGGEVGGTVFKIGPTGTETILYTFTGGTDGGEPLASLVRDKKGNLYGTTSAITTTFGTIFEIAKAGTFSTLYSFSGGSDGSQPYAGLILDSTGNLYGTTRFGGTGNSGVVFKLVP